MQKMNSRNYIKTNIFFYKYLRKKELKLKSQFNESIKVKKKKKNRYQSIIWFIVCKIQQYCSLHA